MAGPAAQAEALTLEVLAGLPHVVLATEQEDRVIDGRVTDGGLERRVAWADDEALNEAVTDQGWSRTISLTTQDAVSALAVASRTDMVALAPRRLASALAEHYGLKLFEPPYQTTPSAIEALWRRDLSESAPIEWLRGCLRAAAAEL